MAYVMSDDSDLERDLPASERKIQQARENGQVLRSKELAMTMIILGSALVLWSMQGFIVNKAMEIFRLGLSFKSVQMDSLSVFIVHIQQIILPSMLLMAPFLAVSVFAALAGNIALGGWNFTTKALEPNFGRLNPLSGLKNMFGWHGLGELVKSLLKASLIGGIGAWLIWRNKTIFVNLMQQHLLVALKDLGAMMVSHFAILAGLFVLIVAGDVPFQWWRYYAQMKMSLEEYKRESKETEGDPHIKGRIRQQQREMARKRMMSEIHKADVIVTNPTHYSVALKYDESGMRAPRVVAKGVGDLALKIREIGNEHQILMMEAPPLARALYTHVKLDQEIPGALYSAVAQVLAYVYQLKAWKKGESLAAPIYPEDFLVPEDLDPGVKEDDALDEGQNV